VAQGTKFRFAKFCATWHSISSSLWPRTKSGRVQSRNTLQKPLFDRLFSVLALFSSIDLVQKSAVKKKRQTSSNRIGPDPEAGGSRFWTSKTSLSPQVAPKTGPVTKSQILLTTRLMSTSGALTHLHSLEIAPSAQLNLAGIFCAGT
jgi:hypothetical protein